MAGANILGDGDRVLSVDEPVEEVKTDTDTVPTIGGDEPKEVEDTKPEPEKKEWDKERQYKDEMLAERRKREETEAKLQEMIAKQGEQMSSAINQLAETMKGPKNDPRNKLIEELDSLDEDDENYLRKSKELMKKVISLEPTKVESKGVDPDVLKRLDKLDSFETELQSLRSELSLERGTNKTNSFLDRLDMEYGTKKYRTDAVAHVKEISKDFPEGTPDSVFERLYEDAYKLVAVKEPQAKETKVPESLAGVKGAAVAESEEDEPTGMLDTRSAKAKMIARLKGIK